MIVDKYGRRFQNLRISLTASCNYACTYCVPNGNRLMKAHDELGIEESLSAVHLLKAAADIKKIRITGGEPLISDKFDDFLLQMAAMDFDDLSLTTNGQFLSKKIDVIKASNIRRINVSLDTLNPSGFRKMARGGDLATVLEGIKAIRDLDIFVKINMVPIRGENHDEVLRMLNFCLEIGAELRYIELMRMGHLAHSPDFNQRFVGAPEILDILSESYEFCEIQVERDSTARRFKITGGGAFGIIANESQPFCAGCSRLRLASNGQLFGCLSSRRSQDIRPLLTMPFDSAVGELKKILKSALADKQVASFKGETTVMKFIGG